MDFLTTLSSSTLIFDGGLGTELKAQGVAESILELANISQPEKVQAVHQAYVAAGADIITTNTFRSVTLAEDQLVSSTRQGIALAKASQGRFVALSLGPTGQETITEKQLEYYLANYQKMAELGEEDKVDLLLLETFYDGPEVLAVVKRLREVTFLPLFVTLSIRANGQLFSGEPVYPLLLELIRLKVDGIGLNCLEMSAELVELSQKLRHLTHLPLVIQGSAGVPTSTAKGLTYPCSDQEFVAHCQQLLAIRTISIGGCCGTTPATIKALSKLRCQSEEGE